MLKKDTSLDMVITALAADYRRRAEEIAKNELPVRIIMEYRYYNTKMFNAVAEIVGEADAERYISDIGSGKGYSQNTDIYVSEVTYYKRKRECKEGIARTLNFI